jgi:hypothetical protein
MKPDRILQKIVVRSIDVGILLEKRRLVLEDIDSIDRRGRSFPRNPWDSTRSDLNEEAEQLEIQVRRLEEAVKKERELLAVS